MVQNNKFCLSRSISQEPYIIWLSFMVYICKMIISSGVFFIFSKFWFSRLSWGWKDKKWPKMTKIPVCCSLYFRNHIAYDLNLWYTCMYERIISPDIFLIFLKSFDFRDHWEGGWGGKKAKNGPKWQKVILSHLISHKVYIIWLWFLLHMVKMMISPATFFI